MFFSFGLNGKMIMVMENRDNSINRNASPTSFGWAFQTGAGIFLMLSNIKEFDEIRIEGIDEDIEIIVGNKKIYAQAKSTTRMGTPNDALSILKKALETLEQAYLNHKDQTKELIYITNFSNPLCSKYEKMFQTEVFYRMDNLEDEDAQRIKEHSNPKFPFEKFKIMILRFNGENLEKFNIIKEKIKEFLIESIGDSSFSNRVFDYWYTIFDINATDIPTNKKPLCLKKEAIVWPIIDAVFSVDSLSEEEFNKMDNYQDFDEIIQTYRNIISLKGFKYEFINRVLNPYFRLKSANPKVDTYTYINNNWELFNEEFTSIDDNDVRRCLIKIIMLMIIKKNKKMRKIKEAANL